MDLIKKKSDKFSKNTKKERSLQNESQRNIEKKTQRILAKGRKENRELASQRVFARKKPAP